MKERKSKKGSKKERKRKKEKEKLIRNPDRQTEVNVESNRDEWEKKGRQK